MTQDVQTAPPLTVPPAPAPVPMPAFAHWIFARKLELKAVGAALNCSHEQVRIICLPFADRRRRVPTKELMARIVAYTAGAIRPGDFYPDHLNLPENEPRSPEAQP